MERFDRVAGIAVPFLRINVDTDQITPGPYIMRAYNEGWAVALFGNWRFDADGKPRPDFILNQEPWQRGTILLADRNFGCGSSRESAPKALRAFGFRSVIAPSFGGIFFNNCFRNGLLPVELPIESIRTLAGQMEAAGGNASVAVDLEAERVTAPDGRTFAFTTPKRLREMLLQGLDEIEYTLSQRAALDAYWRADEARRPWVYRPGE
ncbi:MAG: 3-isopropylmalate dehydratase small subunit [Lautropia sp.]